MQSLHDKQARKLIVDRVNRLSATTKAKWGSMSVSQMLKHTQYPLLLATKQINVPKANLVKRLIFKLFKSQLYNDKPWKKGLPTIKTFKAEADFDFDTEKHKLIEEIHSFGELDVNFDYPKHPLFGNFTKQQWGQMQYKHLNHHLEQFGT